MSENTKGYITPDFILNEEAPRIPDRDDIFEAYEQGLNCMQVEYKRLMNFDEIGEKMSYCTRQVRRFLEKGTEQLEEVAQENSD